MRFSIVIPVALYRNAEILESIKNLDFSKEEYEVIVERGTNPSENRNKGAEKAKGEFVVFLDDDALIKNNYLNLVNDFIEKHNETDVIGGPQLTPENERGFAKISGYALGSKFGAWKLARRYSAEKESLDTDETAITSANLTCKKRVIEKIKFDTNLFPGEDPKFISDAKKAGFKVAYTPNIIVYHKRRGSIMGLIKQFFNYGKARTAKEGFFETMKRPFFFIPSIFLLYLIFLMINALNYSITGTSIEAKTEVYSFNNPAYLLNVPLLTYLLVALIFAFYDSIKNKDYKAFVMLPFIYPTIHLSYGAGMVFGYIKKFVKKR